MHPPLGGVRDVAFLLNSGRALEETLDAVAAAIAEPLGFGTVAINLYRPAWDDYEVVAVHGNPAAREALLGTRTSAAEWDRLVDDRFRRRGAYVIEAGTIDWSEDFEVTWVPEARDGAEGRDAWHPEDAIFVPLLDAHGHAVGIVSVDEPLSGRRPCAEQLDGLAAIAGQAALAIVAAQHARAAARHRAAVEHLLRVSARVTEQRSVQDTLEAVAEGVRDALGFEKITAWLVEDGHLRLTGSLGWPEGWDVLSEVPVSALDALLAPTHMIEGCVLVDQATAHALVPEALRGVYRSIRNGHGPHGWQNHWLIVPIRAADGTLTGGIWVDDPSDHMIPPPERLQALRAFANQAANAIETARHLEQLRDLAEHDPLTGLRNRRGLHVRVGEALAEGAALLVVDVDHFKRINDALGYDVGDRVLQTVAHLIRRELRPDDSAVRLGGEEFALLLPCTDGPGALAVAERLRRLARERCSLVPWGLSVSIGVAAGQGGTAEALLRDATRAMFAAKRLGRDRCVVYSADTLETLLARLDDGEASSEQLSAVMMLAETLDLRDAGTARHSHTVGQFAEAIAAAFGWTPERVERLRVAGVLHDIGKLAVADSILHKPGSLTDAEFAEIKRHPDVGARILERANLRDIAEWVACHHERVDGRGYPAGRAGDAIPIEARVLAVADAYEAMIADRPYRRGLGVADARAELRRRAGSQFDLTVVDAFLRVLDRADAGEPLHVRRPA